MVNYNQPNPAESEISNWLIQNPQRVNLATIGFSFGDDDMTEEKLEDKSQTLDLWTGQISSAFAYNGAPVKVETWADSSSDTIGIAIKSELLSADSLGIFFDFPLPTRNKFDAPFVGVFNATDQHITSLEAGENSATIRHDIDATSYYVTVAWDANAEISGPFDGTHRYMLKPLQGVKKIKLSVTFSPAPSTDAPSFAEISTASTSWWESFWRSGAFIDLTGANSPNATELQRRTILSQYLTAVNSASSYPPQGEWLALNS